MAGRYPRLARLRDFIATVSLKQIEQVVFLVVDAPGQQREVRADRAKCPLDDRSGAEVDSLVRLDVVTLGDRGRRVAQMRRRRIGAQATGGLLRRCVGTSAA